MQVKKAKSGSVNRSILTAMITNRKVLAAISSQWEEPGLFASKMENTIGEWCVSYYNKYGRAPELNIKSRFDKWAGKNKNKDLVEPVETFLSRLSSEYESRKKQIKADFIIDEAQGLFRRAQLLRTKADIEQALQTDEPEEAIKNLEGWTAVTINDQVGVNVLSDERAIKNALDNPEADILIRYPGAAGNFFEDTFSRGHLVSFMAPEKTGKCVSEDMEIVLADGTVKTIKEIVNSNRREKVLSLNEDSQKIVKTKISDLWDNGVKECFRVTTRTGREVETTGNHKYLTPDGWKLLEDLKVGDYIAVPKRLSFFGTQNVPDELVKFISYMIAEGCTTVGQGSFTNTDPILITDFLKSCKKLGVKWRHEKQSYWLSGANPLYRKYGLKGCSAKTKVIPSFVFKCPKKQVALFLRILFSCDGCLLRKGSPKIELTLANKKLIMQIQSLLTRFGIVSSFSYKISLCEGKEFDSWRLTINDEENVSLFLREIGFMSYKQMKPFEVKIRKSFLDSFPTEIAKRFYSELELELQDRKSDKIVEKSYYRKGSRFRKTIGGSEKAASIREQIQKGLPIMRQSFWKARSTKTGEKYLNSDILWDKVAHIENVGKKKTYDLSVPIFHNFVANNVIVHNTFQLIDTAWMGAEQGNNVIFFACGDMNQQQMLRRFMARACKRPFKPGKIRIPTSLEAGDPPFPKFKEKEYKDYLSYEDSKAKRESIEWKDRLRLYSYPNSSVNINKIRNVIETEKRNGWVPDIVVIDYADILQPIVGQVESRDTINATWKGMRNLAYDLLVVTATQSNAGSYDGEVLGKKNFSEDKRKLAHANAIIGINVIESEKENNMRRFNFVVARENEFVETKCVYAVGCLGICRPIIHSSF